jgi:hypothetical protein
VFTLGSGSVVDSTVAGNTASASGTNVTSQGGGLYGLSTLTLEATIVANNTALQGLIVLVVPHRTGTT